MVNLSLRVDNRIFEISSPPMVIEPLLASMNRKNDKARAGKVNDAKGRRKNRSLRNKRSLTRLAASSLAADRKCVSTFAGDDNLYDASLYRKSQFVLHPSH